jgi:hypothetical protein
MVFLFEFLIVFLASGRLKRAKTFESFSDCLWFDV